MGTILRIGRFRFVIFSNEPQTEPPHVHVVCDRTEAKFLLSPLRLMRVRGMAAHDVTAAARLVAEHREFLERAFHDLHPES